MKDGLILGRGGDITYYFRSELPTELYGKMHAELKRAVPIFERLAEDFATLGGQATAGVAQHVRCKWWLYTKTLLHSYRWYVDLYEAKLCYDNKNIEEMQKLLKRACATLEEYLELRKCAEYGEFENWYRDELKMNVKEKLDITKQLLN